MRPTLFRHGRKYWAQFILKYIIYFNFVNIYSIHDKTDIPTHLLDYLQAVSPLSTIQISLEVFLSQCWQMWYLLLQIIFSILIIIFLELF